MRARTLRGDVSQAELSLGWRAAGPLAPDAPAMDLAAAILGTGRGSWLYRGLREPGLVTWISSHYYAPTELGLFGVAAELAPERVPEALDAIAAAVARLTLLGPPADEIERARTLLRARWARRLEPMEGRAAALAAAEALDGYALLDREFEALAAVEPDDVREAAARYLQPDAVSAVLYLPDGTGQELTAEQLGGAFAVSELRPPVPSPSASAPVVRAPTTRFSSRREADVVHTNLPGADLLVRRKSGVPLVHLGIYLPRQVLDPPAQAGLAALTVRSAVRAAGDLDAGALAFAFERLGGTLGPVAASDWVGLATTVLAEHLGPAAALLDLVHTSPRLEEGDVLRERGLMLAEAQQVADDMFRFPFQLAFAAAGLQDLSISRTSFSWDGALGCPTRHSRRAMHLALPGASITPDTWRMPISRRSTAGLACSSSRRATRATGCRSGGCRIRCRQSRLPMSAPGISARCGVCVPSSSRSATSTPKRRRSPWQGCSVRPPLYRRANRWARSIGRRGPHSTRQRGWSRETRRKRPSPWRSRACRGVTLTAPPSRSGRRWRAASADGYSRRCATAARWPTRSSPLPGSRRAPAPL